MNLCEDRLRGLVFGKAIGDALGLCCKFMSKKGR